MKASFNGDIPELPGIAIDNFEDTRKRAYFLSHCHADHTTGLNALHDHLRSNSVYIYMSEPSAAIVETNIDERLKKFIKPLKLERTTILIPGDNENQVQELYVGVTLIPASHCFGSVMFLFETPLKKILYTGDFRMSENSVSKMAQLHDINNKPIKLDVLYVDTTFQDGRYETFPKRTETIDSIVLEINKWLSFGEDFSVALVPSARYGYEYIFNKIYERVHMKVYVESNWKLYSGFLDRLPGVTNEKNTTRIHLCSKFKKHCGSCNTKASTDPKCLQIHFSAMKWDNFEPEDLFIVWTSENSVSVCFATHCSRSELIHFVEYLAPGKVVGFSEPYMPVKKSAAVTPRRWTPKRSAEKLNDGPKKVPKHVLRQIFG